MSFSDELRKYDEIIKNCDDAIENCDGAIKNNPDNRNALLAQMETHRKTLCEALYNKGILYGKSGRSDEAYKAEQMNWDAIIFYLECNLDTPIEIKQQKNLTWLISKLRDIKSINTRKNITETIWNGGEWLTKCREYDKLCDYDKAIATCDDVIKFLDGLLEKSDDIQKNGIKIILGCPWTIRGIELSKLGKSEEAIKSYDTAIELNPYVIAWVAKGYELSKLGKSIEAIEAYKNMLAYTPDEPTALFNLAVEYSKINPHKAIETYEICIEETVDPQYKASCFNKGIEIGKMEFEHESVVKYESIEKILSQLGIPDPFDVTNSIQCGNIKEVTNQHSELIKQLPNGTLIKFRYKQSEYYTQVNALDYEYPTLNKIFSIRGISVNVWAQIYGMYRDENGHWLPLDNLRTEMSNLW